MLIRLAIAILLLIVAFTIPFYFNETLYFVVKKFGVGWVLTSIIIRIVVIVFFALSLKLFLTFSKRLIKLKLWFVLMIALLTGFAISFIEPIYAIDYGLMNDGQKLQNALKLEQFMNEPFIQSNSYSLVGFFTTHCDFCETSIEKIGANIEAGQKIKVHGFFSESDINLTEFLTAHNGGQIKSITLEETTFLHFAGYAFPSIFLINQKGETLYHWTGDEMNFSALDYLKALEQ